MDIVKRMNKTDLFKRQGISYIILANRQMNQDHQVSEQEQMNAPRYEEVEQVESSITERSVGADAAASDEVQPQNLKEHNDAHARLPPVVQLEEQPSGKEEKVTQEKKSLGGLNR